MYRGLLAASEVGVSLAVRAHVRAAALLRRRLSVSGFYDKCAPLSTSPLLT